MARGRSRHRFTESGDPLKLGFDDPVRWVRHLLRIAIKRAQAGLTSPLFLMTSLFVSCVLSVGLLLTFRPSMHPVARPPVARADPVDIKAVERLDGKNLTDPRMTERVAPPVPVTREGIPLSPPFEIIDGQTFGNTELSLRLIGITGPPRESVCLGDDGNPWACGLAARAALNNLLRASQLSCDALIGLQRPVEGLCRLPDGTLLAARLVSLGFAKPAQPGIFEAELVDAKRNRRGLWNGGWTFWQAASTPTSQPDPIARP